MGTLPIPPPPISSGARIVGWEAAAARGGLDAEPLPWGAGVGVSVGGSEVGVGRGVYVGGIGVGVWVTGSGVDVGNGVSVGGIWFLVGVRVGGKGVHVDVAVGVGGIGVYVAAGLGVLVGVGVTRTLGPQPLTAASVNVRLTRSTNETSVCRL
jgi:hypothetical protein